MGTTWGNYLDESELDLTGFIRVNWARVNSNGRIIRNSVNLIDRQTTEGTLVEKYLNRNLKKIEYASNISGVIYKVLVTEDGLLMYDVNGNYIILEGF